jgi:hypothetical protein
MRLAEYRNSKLAQTYSDVSVARAMNVDTTGFTLLTSELDGHGEGRRCRLVDVVWN